MSPPASPNKRLAVTIFFCAKRSHQSLLERILIWLQRQFLADMTRLTIAEDPGEEFAIRGHNTVTDADEDGIIFYDDVTKNSVRIIPSLKNEGT